MLPQLRAERQLDAIEAASLHAMSPQAQRDVFRRLTRRIGNDERPAKATAADLAAIGITVERVDAEGQPVSDGTSQDESKVGGETT